MSDALENDSNFGHWQLLLTHRQGPFQVHANQQWFDTGIDLFEGETFATYVAASDRWTYGGPQSDGFGVRGETSRDALLPTMALGMLVGRVGASAAFQIGGAEHRLTSPARGRLYLSINDVPGTFADNRGYMGVVIY
jgi:hypothetical protein